MTPSLPYDHSDLCLPLVEYLHTAGIVNNPMEDQASGELPGIFLGPMDDEPDAAISVQVIDVQQDATDSNPTVTFQVAIRSEPYDVKQLHELGSAVFLALHNLYPTQLTATRSLGTCRRLRTGVAVLDENRRWIRVDAYQARVKAPKNL